MTTKEGIAPSDFAKLAQMSVAQFREYLRTGGVKPISPFAANSNKNRFAYNDALALEVARQFSDHNGLSMSEANRLIVFALQITRYVAHNKSSGDPGDYWFAVLASRNTWDKPFRSLPRTTFGTGEYWAENHFAGTLGAIAGRMNEWIGRDQVQYPDSDPARIFMCNVSAADRRLRKRSAELGIEIVDDELAST